MPLRARILVAEDNEINGEIIGEILNSCHCEAFITKNGREALEFFDQSSFDLLFLDIQMPEMDGLAVARMIRMKNKAIPIIGITASVFSDDHERCLIAGINEVVNKPFEFRDIESLLNKYLKV